MGCILGKPGAGEVFGPTPPPRPELHPLDKPTTKKKAKRPRASAPEDGGGAPGGAGAVLTPQISDTLLRQNLDLLGAGDLGITADRYNQATAGEVPSPPMARNRQVGSATPASNRPPVPPVPSPGGSAIPSPGGNVYGQIGEDGVYEAPGTVRGPNGNIYDMAAPTTVAPVDAGGYLEPSGSPTKEDSTYLEPTPSPPKGPDLYLSPTDTLPSEAGYGGVEYPGDCSIYEEPSSAAPQVPFLAPEDADAYSNPGAILPSTALGSPNVYVNPDDALASAADDTYETPVAMVGRQLADSALLLALPGGGGVGATRDTRPPGDNLYEEPVPMAAAP